MSERTSIYDSMAVRQCRRRLGDVHRGRWSPLDRPNAARARSYDERLLAGHRTRRRGARLLMPERRQKKASTVAAPSTTGRGSVYQRTSDGRWVGSFLVDGRRFTVSATTEPQARKALIRKQGEVARDGAPDPGISNRATVKGYADVWINTSRPGSDRKRSPRTGPASTKPSTPPSGTANSSPSPPPICAP
jgi:hypothetical protein